MNSFTGSKLNIEHGWIDKSNGITNKRSNNIKDCSKVFDNNGDCDYDGIEYKNYEKIR
jgi:hypothetical protein